MLRMLLTHNQSQFWWARRKGHTILRQLNKNSIYTIFTVLVFLTHSEIAFSKAQSIQEKIKMKVAKILGPVGDAATPSLCGSGSTGPSLMHVHLCIGSRRDDVLGLDADAEIKIWGSDFGPQEQPYQFCWVFSNHSNVMIFWLYHSKCNVL